MQIEFSFQGRLGGDNTILINDSWEFVRDIDDAIKIIEENINSEFAHKCKELFDCNERIEELEDEVSDLRSELDDANIQLDDYDNLDDKVNTYEENIDEIEKNIMKNDDGESEYYKGMQKALDIIKQQRRNRI